MGEDDVSSVDVSVSSPRETQSPIVSRLNGVASLRKRFNGVNLQFGVVPKVKDDREKLLTGQVAQPQAPPTKSKWFRQDTEKRAAQAAEKEEKKRIKAAAKSVGKTGKTLASFKISDKTLVPIFIEKCVNFIEREVDSEGIYRVPGNRSHVDLLYQKFDEEDNVDIATLDIPVNAVATALKDFFSKHLPPIFEADLMTELEEIAGSRGGLGSANPMNMEVKADRSCRLMALRGLLNKLPPTNFSILKFIFQHFVR
jgi:glucocorticoid receptor DNA-binding factor 1